MTNHVHLLVTAEQNNGVSRRCRHYDRSLLTCMVSLLFHPPFTARCHFLFPEGGAGLESIDEILAGAEGLLAVGAGSGHEYDAVIG
jgi:hypothetical protein